MAVPLRHLAANIALAEAHRGVRETEPNWGPRVREYLENAGITVPAPWCAAFVQWCGDRAARHMRVTNPLDDVEREALVADYHALAAARDWAIAPDEADMGDLVLFRFGGQRWNHIGFVVDPPAHGGHGTEYTTVEGNTDDEGGREGVEVARRKRFLDRDHTLFVRWDEGLVWEEAA